MNASPAEIMADPDRILDLFECCPGCGSKAMEALTWKSIDSDAVTVGCWNCGWMITPPKLDEQNAIAMAAADEKTPTKETTP